MTDLHTATPIYNAWTTNTSSTIATNPTVTWRCDSTSTAEMDWYHYAHVDNQWKVYYDARLHEPRAMILPEPRRRPPAQPRDPENSPEAVAHRLLLRQLTPEQQELYLRAKKFHVIGSNGRRYEIDAKKRWHNVFELDDQGRRIRELCIGLPSIRVPIGDSHLAQKLMIETDESEFLRIANIKDLRA